MQAGPQAPGRVSSSSHSELLSPSRSYVLLLLLGWAELASARCALGVFSLTTQQSVSSQQAAGAAGEEQGPGRLRPRLTLIQSEDMAPAGVEGGCICISHFSTELDACLLKT